MGDEEGAVGATVVGDEEGAVGAAVVGLTLGEAEVGDEVQGMASSLRTKSHILGYRKTGTPTFQKIDKQMRKTANKTI